MPDVNVVVAVVAFVLVAGYAALAWLRHGRDPVYTDDASVLMPAPPPGMTAATATVVAGGGGHVAFMAALLDLASRDEIAFVSEGRDGRRDRVGIAIHGGETADPRVLLNRRNPIGEGETWLLGELKAWHAMVNRDRTERDEPPSPEMMTAGLQMFASMMRIGTTIADDDDSPAARAAREHGLSSLALPDAATFERAYEARTGHAMPDNARQQMELMMSRMSALADPQAIARDPEHAAELLEANADRPLTADEHAEIRTKVQEWAAQATAAPAPIYIAAAEARRLQAPFLFGTLLQTYARRHGWIGGLRLMASIRWYLLGALEIAIGIAVAAGGSTGRLEAVRYLGGGIAAGGAATFLIGRAMPALSKEGSVMKAQLAAYRRTLAATFGQATSLDEVVATHRLPWLETPDQTLVWGIALGLRGEIEALLARTGRAIAAGGPGAAGYAPAWFASGSASSRAGIPATAPLGDPGAVNAAAPAGAPAAIPVATAAPGAVPASVQDPGAMFAGIEAIGSETTQSTSASRTR